MTGKGLWCTKHSKTASRLLSVAPRSAAALYDRYLSCRPTRQGATFITCPPQVSVDLGAAARGGNSPCFKGAAPKPRARTQAAGLLERQPAPRRAHCAGARCRSGLASASRGRFLEGDTGGGAGRGELPSVGSVKVTFPLKQTLRQSPLAPLTCAPHGGWSDLTGGPGCACARAPR